jgi:hypothetical protein
VTKSVFYPHRESHWDNEISELVAILIAADYIGVGSRTVQIGFGRNS